MRTLDRCLALAATLAAGTGTAFAQDFDVLFIVIDDLGTDRLALTTDYTPGGPFGGLHYPTPTPAIDGLAEGGVLFVNAYGSPLCSPARALLMTGQYGHRTRIGTGIPLDQDETNGLDPDTTILPEVLKTAGYETGVFGKWHLGGACHLATGDAEDHGGVDRFVGTVSNFDKSKSHHYWKWSRIDSSFPFPSSCPQTIDFRHATEATVDDALEWIGEQTGRWFCHVAFQAVHVPRQWPFLTSPPPSELEILDGMISHTDQNIQRLLDGIDLGTTIVVLMGDNGTQTALSGDAQIMFPPYDPSHRKGTIYEHGVKVPLIVHYPLVGVATPAVSQALVSLVDVFRTVTDLLGIQLSGQMAQDSVSFAPVLSGASSGVREFLFCETFGPNNQPATIYDRSMRNQTFKLIRRWKSPATVVEEELFDLSSDPYEQTDLLATVLSPPAAAAYDALSDELDAIPVP